VEIDAREVAQHGYSHSIEMCVYGGYGEIYGMKMETLPLVSVIVPVYKVENFLAQCVDSILGQTYHNLEIFLVDDGSPDKCPIICDQYAVRDSRVQVIHQTNRGLSAARNVGIYQARGEFILCVDSDDWIESELVEKTVALAMQSKSDVVVFRYQNVSEDGTRFSTPRDSLNFPLEDSIDSKTALSNIFRMKLPNYAWSYLSRRTLFTDRQIYFPEGRQMEDIATTYRIWGSATRIALLHEDLYNYRIRQGSIIGSKNLSYISDCVLSLCEMELYVENEFPDLRRDNLNMSIQYFISLRFTLYSLRKSLSLNIYKQQESKLTSLIHNRLIILGYENLSKINLVKFVLLQMRLTPLLNKISEYRNRRL
jgi:glycosyltransferase involved in cell wall biosynthesis